MKALPFKAQAYIYGLICAVAILTAFLVHSLSLDYPLLLQILVFGLAIFIADLYPIVLPTEGNAEVTVSCAFKTAVAIIYGPTVAIPATLLGTLLAEFTLRRAWYKAVFNACEMTLTSASMSVAYELLYDGTRMPFHSARNAAAVGGMVLTYACVNTALVTAVVSLASGASFRHVWKVNFRDSAWNNLTIIPLGSVMATLWLYQPWSILTLVLPLIVVRRSFQFIGELQLQTREALIGMADAIDQRDSSTYQHSQRVADIAGAVAEQMGLPLEEVETIRMAARLHDLGKIGMSNALLFKPGKFTERELAEFRRHPVIGAELVKSFRLFREGQDLVLHHHERYDGTGYPAGLSGEEIPFGSRILAVADAFDAMISERPYRPPLTLARAIDELITNQGTQFAPEVVQAFMEVLEREETRELMPEPRAYPSGLLP